MEMLLLRMHGQKPKPKKEYFKHVDGVKAFNVSKQSLPGKQGGGA